MGKAPVPLLARSLDSASINVDNAIFRAKSQRATLAEKPIQENRPCLNNAYIAPRSASP